MFLSRSMRYTRAIHYFYSLRGWLRVDIPVGLQLLFGTSLKIKRPLLGQLSELLPVEWTLGATRAHCLVFST